MTDKKSKLAAGSIIIILGSIILRLGGFIYRFILSRLLSPNKEVVNAKYQELKELLNNNDLDEILKKINDDLDIEINS